MRDSQLKGLILRIQPSGIASYYVQYGRGKRMFLGRANAIKPAQAREDAKKILGEAYAGKDPMATRRRAKAYSFASFIDKIYAPWAEANIRSAENTVRRLKSTFPDLQSKKLDEITPWLVEKWRSQRLKGGTKPATVNRDLADLKSSLAKAVDWGHLETHPLASVKRSRVDSLPITRYLTDLEEKRLIAALDGREERLRQERDSANAWRFERGYPALPDLREKNFTDHLKPMVLLSLHTGVRRGELFHLTWIDIDLVNNDLTVRGTTAKSGRTRHVPLNNIAVDTLSGWSKETDARDGLVFPGRDGKPFDNVNTAWRSVLNTADIERFRWHDLRHSFASRLIMAGVDLNTVRELLGHADYHMTLRYAHLAPAHKAEAVARLV